MVEESVWAGKSWSWMVVRDSKKSNDHSVLHRKCRRRGRAHRRFLCTAPCLTIAPTCSSGCKGTRTTWWRPSEVIGGTNVQFAHDRNPVGLVIIEINPAPPGLRRWPPRQRASPSPTSPPCWQQGCTLDELPFWRDGTLEKYTPRGDYVVVMFARWAFEKFEGSIDKLGTQMRPWAR
jgi:carbamoyl-phosphate synthase large subunit